MFKIHPISNIINIILFLLILCFSRSSIFIFIIVLLLLVLDHNHEKLMLFLSITLFIVVINILCGKLIILGKVCTFIGYLCTIVVDYERIELIRVYDTLFSSTNYERTEKFLKLIHYREYFVSNFNIMIDTTKKLGYHNGIRYYIFCIKNAIKLTKQSLQQMIETYEKRFYFNSNRNKYKVAFSIMDVFMLLVHSLVLIIVLMLGVKL